MQKAIRKGYVTREHGYWRSNDCDMPVRGEQKHRAAATHQDGPALAPEVSDGWTGGSAGPTSLLPASLGQPEAGVRTEARSHGLIQALSTVAFHGACGTSRLCSCSPLVALD